jgi:hypothetical protein
MKVRLVTGVVALWGTLAFAGAPATATFSQCSSNRVCLWGNNDYDWLLIQRSPGLGVAALSSGINNRMDSWANRTTTNARGYDGSSGTGDCQTFARGSSDNNVNTFNSDEVSSTATNGGC